MSAARETMPFDWKNFVSSEISRGRLDPHAIAKKMVKAIPAHQLREILAEVLPDFIRDEISRMSREVARGGGATKSTRWSETAVEFVPGKGYMRMEEMTAEDCDTIAEYRAQQAADVLAWAHRWKALGAKVRELGVATVGGLAPDVIAEVMK